MADRVHPEADSDHSLPPSTTPTKPLLPKGTFVIQIPKDQIYRIPPPENSDRIQNLANRKPRRSCCCTTIAVVFVLLILLALAGAILYFVFRPEALKYSIESISVGGINVTSSAPIFPRFAVKIRAENPNDKLSVYYDRKGSSVNINYAGVNLCNGELPTYHQPANNVTVIQTALKGSNIILARDVHAQLVRQERERNVPLKLKVKAPVRVKIGILKIWEITVTVKCDVGVDQFTEKSKIVSKKCDYRVKLW